MVERGPEILTQYDEPREDARATASEPPDLEPVMGVAGDIVVASNARRSPLAGMLARRDGSLGPAARKGVLGLLDQVLVSGTRFATTVLIGRLCGPAELGIYSLGFALFMFVATIQESLVLAPYTVYGCRLKKSPRAEYAGNVLVQYGALALLAMLGLSVAGLLLPTGKLAALGPVMWVLVGIIPLALLREFCRRMSFAHLKPGEAVLLDLVVALTQVGGLALLALSGLLSAATAFLLMGLASGVAGVAWLAAARRSFVLRRAGLLAGIERNWTFGKWVFAGNMTSMFYGYWLYWLLALVIAPEATGIFAACQAVVALSNPFILGVGNMLTPGAAHVVAAGDLRRLQQLIVNASLLVVSAMACFCCVVGMFADELLLLVYGTAYADHGWLVTALAVAVLASSAGMVAGMGLCALERTDANFRADVAGLVVMALVTGLLVLPWGILGVACGLLAGNLAKTAAKWRAFLGEVRAPLRKEAFA